MRRLIGRRTPALIVCRQDDEGAAMLLVLSVMMAAVMLLAALTAVITSEEVPTQTQLKAAQTLAAAQAGESAATSLLRAASSSISGGGVAGDLTKLPCTTPSKPLTGSLPGRTAPAYSVQISYYTVSPAGQSQAWRTAHALTCTTGSGPSSVPLYALIVSQATGSGPNALVTSLANRAVEEVYTFTRTDQALLGGTVETYNLSLNLCWQAPSVSPTAGSTVSLATCSTTTRTQSFSYRSDYTLALTDSQNPDGSGGMCLTASSTYTQLTLQPCGPVGWNAAAPTYTTQRWAYNDGGQFEGINAAGTSLYYSSCITSGSSAGSTVYLTSCSSAPSWVPAASVGAGAAGTATSQLINYAEYGRCLDVTRQNVNATFLIDYPCKQDPTSTVLWNQRWVWDGAGTRQFQTTYGSTLYCLTTSTTAGGRVLVSPCVTGLATQQWTMTGSTGNRTTSYEVVDSNGRCMAPGAPDSTLPAWSTIVVAACDGSAAQKWNAPPTGADGGTSGQRETTGG